MLELGEVAVQSLVPEPLQSAETPAAYMKALPEFDSDMDAQLQAAEAEDQCLRFVGEQQRKQTARICMVCVKQWHPHSAAHGDKRAKHAAALAKRVVWGCHSAEFVQREALLSLNVPVHGSVVLLLWSTAVVRG